MSLEAEREASEDAWLPEAYERFFQMAPAGLRLAIRAIRAVIIFIASVLLLSAQPAIPSVWGLAFAISVLTLFNVTKWLSVGFLALLMLSIILPPIVKLWA